MAEFSSKSRPCPIAHRGCMEAGPENSLTAFEEAEGPESFRGFPIALISAGLLALAFMGFSGLRIF